MPLNLRTSIASRIEKIGTPKTIEFANYIRGDEKLEEYPCWGDILETFEESFTNDDERLQVWAALVDERHARPIQLFLMSCSDCPEMLQAIEPDVSNLPVRIQRAFAAMVEEDPPEENPNPKSRLKKRRREIERARFEGEIGMMLPKFLDADLSGSEKFKAKMQDFFRKAYGNKGEPSPPDA